MNIDSAEENKKRRIATAVTVGMFSLLLIFLFLYSIISPKLSATENSTIEISVFSTLKEVSLIAPESKVLSENIASTPGTSINSENTSPVIITKKTEAETIKENFIAQKLKTQSGNENTGAAENPCINCNGNDLKKSEGTKTENGNYGINLIGRKIITMPSISNDSKEEGKVVVEIIVDHFGNVIKAAPNGRGTNTNNPALKQKAKQAAMSAKFDASKEIEEQKGTITIVFSF